MIGIIVSTIFIAVFVNLILKKFHLPTIIGYIFTGTIIAYMFELHEAVNNHDLREIAEFGVVFLMFTIGLEFSFKALVKMKKEVFVTGSLQIFVTTVFVYVICHYVLNFDFKTSMVIGAALALSSTAIVLKTFNETKEINKPYGKRVLGILIMQDIAVIPILLMISIFAMQDDANIFTIVLHTGAAAIGLIVVLFLTGKFLIEPFFDHVAKTKSDELFVASVLAVAIGSSYLAYYFGFSYSLGAFVAGMMIAETKFKHQVEADLTPFRNILLGIFFITVGMQINFEVIYQYAYIILLLLPILVIVKYFIIYTIVRIDETKRVAFKTAISLVQIGEFSLAVLELARNNQLIDPVYSQILIVTIVISMVLTPIVLKNLTRMAARVIPEDSMMVCNVLQVDENTKDHIVVLGYGNLGQEVVKKLKKDKKEYIIIEHNLTYFEQGRVEGEPIIYGNAIHKHILESVKIKETSVIIVAIDNFEQVSSICQSLQDLEVHEKTVVKVTKCTEKETLDEFNLKHIVVQNFEVGQGLVKEAYITQEQG